MKFPFVSSSLPHPYNYTMQKRFRFMIVTGAHLLLLVSSSSSSCFAFIVTTTTSARATALSLLQSSQRNNGTIDNKNNENANPISTVNQQQQPHRLVLAIFPLRKTVRLPTEVLTLNLYEQRYLAMAEWILGMHDNETDMMPPPPPTTTTRLTYTFGALYTSDKAQIVKGAGLGPIVPIVQVGNIGVLFSVEHVQDDMVPTRDEKHERRRIRLVGTGIARFRIERILHNGYDQDSSNNNDSPGGERLPFIVAETSLVLDEAIANDDEEMRIETMLNELSSKAASIQQQKQDEGSKSSSSSSSMEDDDDDAGFTKNEETNSGNSEASSLSSSSPLVHREMLLLKQLIGHQVVSSKEAYYKMIIQHEMQSFAIASTLLSRTSTRDRLDVLGMMTLQERLDYLKGKMDQSKKNIMASWKSWWLR